MRLVAAEPLRLVTALVASSCVARSERQEARVVVAVPPWSDALLAAWLVSVVA